MGEAPEGWGVGGCAVGMYLYVFLIEVVWGGRGGGGGERVATGGADVRWCYIFIKVK